MIPRVQRNLPRADLLREAVDQIPDKINRKQQEPVFLASGQGCEEDGVEYQRKAARGMVMGKNDVNQIADNVRVESCRMRLECLIRPTKSCKFNILKFIGRYCYGLQVFSLVRFPGLQACQTQRRQALFFSSLPRFLRRYRIYAVTHRTARLTSSALHTPPVPDCASSRRESPFLSLPLTRQTVAERPSPLSLTGGYHCGHIQRPAKRHMSGLTHPARLFSHTAT